MKKNLTYELGDITLRLIELGDLDKYCDVINNPSEEVDYFTGTTGSFTREQIENYVKKIVNDETRYDFLITNKKNEILGEIVINGIDYEKKTGHYRIAIFNKENFGKGYGYLGTKTILNFVFYVLNLDEIFLEVYPFNERGVHLYQKLGFEIIDTLMDESETRFLYKKYYLMSKKK